MVFWYQHPNDGMNRRGLLPCPHRLPQRRLAFPRRPLDCLGAGGRSVHRRHSWLDCFHDTGERILIVGRGNNSPDGVPRIKPATERLLNDDARVGAEIFEFDGDDEGAFNVNIL